jgi:hypothetical protein
MTDETEKPPLSMEASLERMGRELKTIRDMLAQVVTYVRDAESEIPEKMRRYMNYMHDVHSVKFMYEELGHPVPTHLRQELERCDDRYRQLLKEAHTDGGAFEKVRRQMADDPENKWDHTRLLTKPKEETS